VTGSRIASFLTEYVRGHPGSRFGPIILAAQGSLRISRATAARQLARLVRFGDLVLLPGRTYGIGRTPGSIARAVVEIRRQDWTIQVLPSGAGRLLSDREFRVVSGVLNFLDVAFPGPPRDLSWWLSAPARLNASPESIAGVAAYGYRMDLETPLSAREPIWHRWVIGAEIADWFQMARPPSEDGKPRGRRPRLTTEFVCNYVPAQARRYEQRLSGDAHLRLQVTLPGGFPLGRVGYRVTHQADPSQADGAEAARIEALSREHWGQEGFRRSGRTLALSIPEPQLDRRYCLTWELPTARRHDQWAGRRH
jgi:hypothetical protein